MDDTAAGLAFPTTGGASPAGQTERPSSSSSSAESTGSDPIEALGFTSALFTEAYPRLHRLAAAVAPPGIDADELVQEAVARMLARARRTHPVDEPIAYLSRSIINLARSRRRRWATRRRLTPPPDRPGQADPAEPDRVDELLDQLPVRQRACLWLRFVEDRSVNETAELLGCTPGTVKSQTAKALATLRRSGLAERDHLEPGATTPHTADDPKAGNP